MEHELPATCDELDQVATSSRSPADFDNLYDSTASTGVGKRARELIVQAYAMRRKNEVATRIRFA